MANRLTGYPKAFAYCAEAHGWDVVVKWADGTQTKRGHPPKNVKSLSVNCRKANQFVVGVWVDGRWHGGWFWQAGQFPTRDAQERLKARMRGEVLFKPEVKA